jgi:DMSO/TMAO reductase YedYZ heme-binding membrane subunit
LRSGWRWLQRGVYLAAVLAVAHQFLAVKGDLATLQGDYTRPLIAGGALLLLFLLRIPPGLPGLAALAGAQIEHLLSGHKVRWIL